SASITANYDPSTGTLTLTGTDTLANYQTALERVVFESFGTTTGTRTITWSASDDINVSAPATTVLSIVLPDPAPSATASATMVLRDSTNGNCEIYNIANNSILAAYHLGQIGLSWNIAGVGSFNGNDTSDMIVRDNTTGEFLIYAVSQNVIVEFSPPGTVGLEWQVAGFGDFILNQSGDRPKRYIESLRSPQRHSGP